MSDPTIPLDRDALSQLLNDPLMTKIVTIVNLASLSILELLEYGFTRKDINRAMAKGVIEFDKSPMPFMPENTSKRDVVPHVLETGDYYFGLLSSKIKLTRLGIYLLEVLKGDTQPARAQISLEPEEAEASLFNKPSPPI